MKTTPKYKNLALAVAFGLGMVACESENRRDTNTETIEVRRNETIENEAGAETREAFREVEDEAGEFSTWVRTNTTRAENATKEEWQELKAEYKRREAELDAKSSTWDDKARKEWLELKEEWKRTEDKTESRLNRG